MSYYRVCQTSLDEDEVINHRQFDNKENAEHYAKNQSSADNKHRYEVQKNDKGEFRTIKIYMNGIDIFK